MKKTLFTFTLLLTVFGLMGVSCKGKADKSTAEPETTNEAEVNNDAPEDKEFILFPVAYIWEFDYILLNETEPEETTEVWAYYEPNSKSWLLTRESSFELDEEYYDWVWCKSDGSYVVQYIDFETGETKRETFRPEITTPKTLSKELILLQEGIVYPDIDLVRDEPVIANSYLEKGDLPFSDAEYHIAESDIDFTPLYSFQNLSAFQEIWNIRLPLAFPETLPGDKLLIEYKMQVQVPNEGISTIRLKAISFTQQYLELE